MSGGVKRYGNDHPEHRAYAAPWEHRRVEHQYFSGTTDAGHEGWPVVIFDKLSRVELTAEQIADYERRAKIVRENGGYMSRGLYEEAGETPRFTQEDRDAMIGAALAAYPEWELRKTWNGEGHTFSVSLKPKPTKEPRT